MSLIYWNIENNKRNGFHYFSLSHHNPAMFKCQENINARGSSKPVVWFMFYFYFSVNHEIFFSCDKALILVRFGWFCFNEKGWNLSIWVLCKFRIMRFVFLVLEWLKHNLYRCPSLALRKPYNRCCWCCCRCCPVSDGAWLMVLLNLL